MTHVSVQPIMAEIHKKPPVTRLIWLMGLGMLVASFLFPAGGIAPPHWWDDVYFVAFLAFGAGVGLLIHLALPR